MNTIQNNLEENPNDHQKEWLNLSLSPNAGYSCSKSSSSLSRKASVKVYTCSFCKRKFYSSQALGGHQNAHRKERDAARRFRLPNTMNAFKELLKVHSFVQKRGTDREAIVAKFTDDGARWVDRYPGEQDVNLKWPGSFHLNTQPDFQQSDSDHMLDLNLKL